MQTTIGKGFAMRFGDKIKRLMDQRGWGIEPLIIKSGLSRATIYNVLAAKWHSEVSDKTVDHLAHAFRLEADEILRGDHGLPIAYHDTLGATEATYAQPPAYEPVADDVVEIAGSPTKRDPLKRGLVGLYDVMEWYKSLNEIDQRAALAALNALTKPVVNAAVPHPKTKAVADAKLGLHRPQPKRKAAS